MKRVLLRAAAMVTALCLALTFGTGAALADRDYSGILDLSQYPTAIDENMNSTDAFAKANSLYKDGMYKNAKSYYMLALNKAGGKSDTYSEGDICNNLVLTMLQLEENETAYRLCRYMLEEQMAQSTEDRYGYMLNLLVCAHANGFSAAKELQDAMDRGYFSFWSLARLADDNQASFRTLMIDMIYNILYMDMEGDLYDGAASLYYLPAETRERLSGDHRELIAELAAQTDGQADPAEKAQRDKINGTVSRKEYLGILGDLLHQVQEWQELSDEPEDLDIQALAEYLDVLMEQAE